MTSSRIRVANAPVSWGALEIEGFNQKPLPYDVVLDEIAETGYAGTELGDWGFMPTDPAVLRDELERRGLALIGAFVPVRLRDPGSLEAGIEHALRVARLLAAVVPEGDRRPDRSSSSPTTMSPTRGAPCMPGASHPRWPCRTTSGRATPVAPSRSRGRCGRRQGCARSSTPTRLAGWRHRLRPIAFSPRPTRRCWVSSSIPGITCSAPATRALRWSRRWIAGPTASGTSISRTTTATWRGARVTKGGTIYQALRAGIFSELGKGGVDFRAVVRWLDEHGYDGWAVVEQDILPGMGTPKESARRNREFLASLGL